MSKEQPIIELPEKSINTAGFQVPSLSEEHLKWWFNQIPFMKVGDPTPAHLSLYLACCGRESETFTVPDELRSNFALKVFEKRMVSLGMICTPWLSIFIAGISANLAEVVMWSFFLKVHTITIKTNLLAMKDIGVLFPKGLPTPEGMEWMWNLQKLSADRGVSNNLLDLVRMRPNEA